MTTRPKEALPSLPAADSAPEETDDSGKDAAEPPKENKGEEDGGALIREGLLAAMEGRFREFCRERELYEGDAADRINAVFLDYMEDIVLKPDGTGFRFIEDYREEAEEWLRTETKR